MRTVKYFAMATMTMGLLAGMGMFRAADTDKPKYTIEEVMEKAHKGNKKSLKSKVASGAADEKQKKQLLEYYEELAKNPAPKTDKGSAADWKKRTGALVAAAKDVVAAKPGAANSLNKAANCKGCHEIYKTD
ncbi:MAG TPA: hypothetical protein VH575_23420 [Gemmataceae bacterium]|jgi:hypothetical protein